MHYPQACGDGRGKRGAHGPVAAVIRDMSRRGLQTAAALFSLHALPWAQFPSSRIMPSTVQGLEKYLLTKLYDRTIAQDMQDRERDTTLAARCGTVCSWGGGEGELRGIPGDACP